MQSVHRFMREFRRESFHLAPFQHAVRAHSRVGKEARHVFRRPRALYARGLPRQEQELGVGFPVAWQAAGNGAWDSALTVSLGEARERARAARAALEVGKNPIDQRRAERASRNMHTFGSVADELVKDLSPQWKSPIHRRQWVTTLTVDAAPLRSFPASSITTDDVMGVLRRSGM